MDIPLRKPLNAKAMISTNLHAAFNRQINAELWSAYLYLSMSMDAQDKGYPGIAQWFFIQWKEEQQHAEKFARHLTDRMSKVYLEELDGVKQEWSSPMEMFQDASAHERKVTKLIYQLMDLAISDKDYASVSFLQWFVDEQVEEEKSVDDIITILEQIDDNPDAMLSIDHELGKREL